MNRSSVFLIFALLTPAASVAQQVGVSELRQMLSTLHGSSDRKVANRLSETHLTERLSRAEFETLSKILPGVKSRAALLSIADASAFKDLPASQMLPEPAPDAQEQNQVLARAVHFANDQADRLPNFVAIRSAEHFQDVRVYPYSNKIEYYTPGSFRLLDHEVYDVRCSSEGDEVFEQPDRDLDKSTSKQRQPLFYTTIFGYHTVWGDLTWNIPDLAPAGLKPTGAFGPWLQAVTGDVPDAQHEWGYWESAASGKLAVFRFRIPAESSHYTIEYDFQNNSQDPFTSHDKRKYMDSPGYHGEIAIDPVTGQVARIVVMIDFAAGAEFSAASIALEYGSVQFDGATYILPVRGVSLSSLAMRTHNYYFGLLPEPAGEQSDHFTVTSIDDLTFSDYRDYKPRMRILPIKSLSAPAAK